MSPDLDPSHLTPDDRRAEFAALLARGLARLRDRAALTPEQNSTIPNYSSGSGLAVPPETSVTVHAG